MKVAIDFETYSEADLKQVGLDAYSKHPTTEVLCMAYSIDGADTQLWVPGRDMIPAWLYSPTTVFTAWNAAFECNIIRNVLNIPAQWSQFRDSMAVAAANNLPQSLEDCAVVLGATEQKDVRGKKLIQQLCKPHKNNSDPSLLEELYEYCRQDVRTEQAIIANLRPLSPEEQTIWEVTQRINDCGVPVNPAELSQAIVAVQHAQSRVEAEMAELTDGLTPGQVAKLIIWLRSKHFDILDLTADTVSKLLADPRVQNNPTVKRVLELRQGGSQTSTAKYEKMKAVEMDGRIRNTLVYHGASTGRWASRGGLNLQNMARPNPKYQQEELDRLADQIFSGAVVPDMDELSSVVRGALVAPPGKMLVDVDFSSIENRVASWIAGQTDKVELFRQGMDEYKIFATQMYKISYEEVTKQQRQIAKSAVLGCMFGQGAKGLVGYADRMGVTISPEDSNALVNTYRTSYGKVRNCWYDLERASIFAVQHPGKTATVQKMELVCENSQLRLTLPSGRIICWNQPGVVGVMTDWGEKDQLMVLNQNTYTRKWGRNQLYGSSIFQSAVQGCARDFLAEAARDLQQLKIEVINLVHDEIMVLADEGEAENVLKVVERVMTTPPPWASDFPLAVEGWIAKRYRK